MNIENTTVRVPFVSVWDDELEITTLCDLNLRTGEVTNIEVCKNISTGNLENLTGQHVLINGDEYEVIEDKNGFDYYAEVVGVDFSEIENHKIHSVEFCSQGADDSGIIVHFPGGITLFDIACLEVMVKKLTENDEENEDEDLRCVYGFSRNLLIEKACRSLNLTLEYPKADVTVYL